MTTTTRKTAARKMFNTLTKMERRTLECGQMVTVVIEQHGAIVTVQFDVSAWVFIYTITSQAWDITWAFTDAREAAQWWDKAVNLD